MAVHIHFHDSGTPEGARKAALTRKQHGGGKLSGPGGGQAATPYHTAAEYHNQLAQHHRLVATQGGGAAVSNNAHMVAMQAHKAAHSKNYQAITDPRYRTEAKRSHIAANKLSRSLGVRTQQIHR